MTSIKEFRRQRKAPPEIRQSWMMQCISHSMTRLVSDILQLSRGEVVRRYEPYLLDVVEDVLRPVSDEFNGIRLDVSYETETLLLGDFSDRLKQVIRNSSMPFEL
ncbi:MAG: hypothetical protein R2865_11575 [Deinococcales bacterium]